MKERLQHITHGWHVELMPNWIAGFIPYRSRSTASMVSRDKGSRLLFSSRRPVSSLVEALWHVRWYRN